MERLSIQEVKELINQIGPSLGHGDITNEPFFPEGRTDVCAVRRIAKDRYGHSFDTIYFVWKRSKTSILYKEIKNSRLSEENIYIYKINLEKDGKIRIDFGNGVSSNESAWHNYVRLSINN